MREIKTPPFSKEPESKLKQAATMLWQFAHAHGLQMDGCGKSCANDAIRNVEFLYQEKKNG